MKKINKNIELNDFYKDYFIQTRKEIDTDKIERDRLLHFVIILFGGVLVLFTQENLSRELLNTTIEVLLHFSFLIIVTTIFWVRWKKMSHIADRWNTLYKILEKSGEEITVFLENKVIQGLKKRRYVRQDVFLCLSFCLPSYSLLFFSIFSKSGKCLRYTGIVLVIVVIHILLKHQMDISRR